MIPVLIKEQAYKLDKDTIESGHLSQEELMDNAGKSVAQFFCEKISMNIVRQGRPVSQTARYFHIVVEYGDLYVGHGIVLSCLPIHHQTVVP